MATKRKSSRRPVKKKKAAKKARRPTRHKPETLRLRSSSPGLTVNDLQTSIAFYRDALGFTAGEEWRGDNGELRGIELRAGAVAMWINQDDFAKGRDRVKGVGCRTYFNTVQDVDAIAARVKAAGGTLLHEPQTRWGMRDVGIKDPDGFVFTIQGPVKKGR